MSKLCDMADGRTSALPAAVVSPQAPCKCCGSSAAIFGVTDFNRMCCADPKLQSLRFCGIPIYYYRCPRCGFIFTTAFDHFSRQDFADVIYNEDYLLVDGEYMEERPKRAADGVIRAFCADRSISLLDYGGGNGCVERELRQAGFADVCTYDPFVPRFAARPNRKFDCVLSFEVLEHTPRPFQTFADMNSFMAPGGMIFFSTLFPPKQIAEAGANWWYLAPRNGHISAYTPQSLLAILDPMGLTLATFDEDYHAAFRTVPRFAAHLIADPPVNSHSTVSG